MAVAHPLGRYLMKTHVGDRRCANRDMLENRRDAPRYQEEMQANRFAAGPLMPKPMFGGFVDSLGKRSTAIRPASPRPMALPWRRPPAIMSNAVRPGDAVPTPL
jgi:hypothetical protein